MTAKKPVTSIIEKTEVVDVDQLNHYYKNPRIGDVDAIAASLDTLGQFKQIVVNRGTKTGRPNEVLAGNHTLKAAKKLGHVNIAVSWVDVDEVHAKKIVIADNRTNDLAANNDRMLAEILGSLPDLEGLHYSEEALDELTLSLEPPDVDASYAPLPQGVIHSYQMIFDDEGQLQEWNHFLRWLKMKDPTGGQTVASRVIQYLQESNWG